MVSMERRCNGLREELVYNINTNCTWMEMAREMASGRSKTSYMPTEVKVVRRSTLVDKGD